MSMENAKKQLQECGVVGAGGAGFPTYAKLSPNADCLILNCAECEPLLKLHRQLLARFVAEILSTFHALSRIMGAARSVVAIKREYTDTVRTVSDSIHAYDGMELTLLESVYPSGDEVLLAFDAAGILVPPGMLPIEAGVVILNVETVYNAHRALDNALPVTDKWVSIVGEISRPLTALLPLGTSIREAIAFAGGCTVNQPAYITGGPMMGALAGPEDVVTKTTNAILVLPADHALARNRRRKPAIELKRAASACCQCHTCTELCPRHLLGYPLEPHAFMRTAFHKDTRHTDAVTNALYCGACGVCELIACPQGLAPRTLMREGKEMLARAGVRPTKQTAAVRAAREHRRLDEKRLVRRLGLTQYDTDAPMTQDAPSVRRVKIPMRQHIGVAATPCVAVGCGVVKNQVIGVCAPGLCAAVHASINGVVVEATPDFVTIVGEVTE